jgi:ribonuclease J
MKQDPKKLTKSTQKKSSKKTPAKKAKKPDTAIVAKTNTRRGEVFRATRRNSDLVKQKATQHITDVPVNKSVFNGYDGHQFTSGDIKRANKLPIAKKKTLKVIPFGGLGEMGIGKNMMALEYGNDIIVIDMGILFPGADYPGINYMIPDTSYLEARKHKIRGHIFTHGHLDHIGAAKHILRKLPAPVYGSKFTLGMVERQMDEDPTGYTPKYNILSPEKHERVQLGESFSIELLRVNHSIPDSTAVIVRTPVGVVINTGDWRFEKEPIDGKKFDIPRLKEIVEKEKVLLFMSDSTGCEQAGEHEYGEPEISKSFDDIMGRSKGRIILSAFSSQIHRIQSILDMAKRHNRKVAFAGYSMIQNLEVALRAGAIKVPKDTIVRMDDIIKLPDHKVVVVGTGSQGELNAVLARMSTGAHRQIKVKPTDTVVFSSNPIPGNEKNVVRTVDGLMREGSKVFENRTRHLDDCGPLHLSGHGFYDDHVKLLKIVKPKFYLPIHGEFHMLVHNAELAVKETGLPRSHAFVLDSGDVLELTANEAQKTGRIKVGSIMIDQAGTEISDVVLKDRLHMSTEGIFTVLLTVEKKSGRLLSSPDIISRGFIYLKDSEDLMGKIRQYLKQKISRAYAKGGVDRDELKKEIREDVAHILFDETKRTPIVIPVINEVNGKTPAK